MEEQGPRAHAFSLEPETWIGERYRVVSPLGAGGMGEVYEAEDARTNAAVALKILSTPAAGTDIARFERQGLAAARVHHEGIVRVLDEGHHAGRPFLVMERLVGEGLDVFIRRNGPLSVELAGRLGAQIADAVRAAHKQGVVHRDLKPSNIFLVTGAGGRFQAKVLDFGIAKLVDAGVSLTDTGEVFGSTRYMAPEQLKNTKAADDRSDIYAIGCIVYEMLTGRPAFDAPTRTELVLAVLNDAPVPLSRLRPEAPAQMVAAIERAMSKSSAARFANAGALARRLRQ